MSLGETLFASIGWALLWLLRIALLAATVALCRASYKALRQVFVTGPFVDGLHSPDLALQMTGSGGEISEIVAQTGHLPLLRNLVLDSRIFVPLYVASFWIATILLLGPPFPCRGSAVTPWSGMVLLITFIAALLDWSENARLTEALICNAEATSETEAARKSQIEARRQCLLGQARRRAIVKFVGLGIVACVLAIHAVPPTSTARLPTWAGIGLACLLGFAALGMLASLRTARLLESAVAVAGFAIALLSAVIAWRI